MSSIRSSMHFAAAATFGVTLGMFGTLAYANLTADNPTKSITVAAIMPMPGGARDLAIDTRLTRFAIQWSGSNGGDDTPTEDHPF
jgi:hypothetical protein